MGDFVCRIKSTEIALGSGATNANTVSNASLVRIVSSANCTIFVANGWINSTSIGTNTGSITMIATAGEIYVQKYPADVVFFTNSVAATVNAASVAFRD